jgi:hypothetical protein
MAKGWERFASTLAGFIAGQAEAVL